MGEHTASDHAELDSTTAVSRLPLLIVGAVVTLAVLLIIALVAFRGPTDYDPGTPEAALQTFLQASFDDLGEPTLLAMLTPQAQARCQQEFDDRTYDWSWDSQGLRAELDSITVEGDKAVATVSFRHGNSADPFNDYSYSFTDKYTLVRIDGQWLIDRAGWPYQISTCTTRNR